MTEVIQFTGKIVEINGVPVDGYNFTDQLIDAQSFDALIGTPEGYRLVTHERVFAIGQDRREELVDALKQAGALIG